MSKAITATDDAVAPAEAGAQPAQRAISDPREVAALVMGRVHTVKAKEQELATALDSLIDLTQQLTRTYGAQMVAMQQLRLRVKALESQVAPHAPGPGVTVQ